MYSIKEVSLRSETLFWVWLINLGSSNSLSHPDYLPFISQAIDKLSPILRPVSLEIHDNPTNISLIGTYTCNTLSQILFLTQEKSMILYSSVQTPI